MVSTIENQQEFKTITDDFKQNVLKEKFEQVSLVQVLKEIHDKKRITPPKRVRADNFIQMMFLLKNDNTKYDVKILANVVEDEKRLTTGCSAMVMVIDRVSDKPVILRTFKKTKNADKYDLKLFYRRLIAYAKLYKTIANSRNLEFSLVRVDGVKYVWRNDFKKDESYDLALRVHMKNLTKDEQELVLKKEVKRKRHYVSTQALVDSGQMKRVWDIRKTWKKIVE